MVRALLAAALVAATGGCLQTAAAPQDERPVWRPAFEATTAAPFQAPTDYRPPSFGPAATSSSPAPATPPAQPQIRYLPPPPFSSTSLLGPQRTDWKPGGL